MHFKQWKKCLIIIGLVFYTVIFAEFFLCFFKPVPVLPRFIVSLPFGIRGNMPNQDYIHKTPDYRVSLSTNSKGIRCDHEIPYEKSDKVKRIVLLSDSFGMGYGVNLEDTFFVKLKNKLEESGYLIEIVNLSVSGFGTAEELIMFQNEGVKYSPDLTIVSWHLSDLDDNIRSDLFKLDAGGKELVQVEKCYLPAVKEREFLYSLPLYKWIAGNSYLYSWIREFAGRNIKNILAIFRGGGNVYNDNDKDKTKKVKLEKLSLSLLNEIKIEANKIGSKFLILDIPSKLARGKYISTFPALKSDFTFDIVSPVSYFDLFKDKLLYWERSHGHFTPLGTELVAQSLFDHIIDNGLLK